jgi:hypothetical protein
MAQCMHMPINVLITILFNILDFTGYMCNWIGNLNCTKDFVFQCEGSGTVDCTGTCPGGNIKV